MGSTGRQEQEGEDERGEKGGNGEKRKRKKVYVCVCGGGVHITHLCGLSSVLPFGSFLPDTPRPIQMIQKW